MGPAGRPRNRWWWVNMWTSGLPRTPSPPGPPHLDVRLVLELHGLKEIAGDNSFLQRKER